MAEPVSLRFEDAALRRMLVRTPEIVLDEIARGLAEASMLAEREVKERTPTSGAGTLRDSIGALPVTISGTRVTAGVGTSLSYAAPVEEGSKPHWAPIEPLLDWVERKLGKAGEEAEGIARAIRASIAVHGTPAHHMFRDGFAYVGPQVMEILSAAVARAAARVEGGA